jgi:hypothetical protein
MNKLFYIFLIFIFLLLVSCRKSSRNYSSRNKSDTERVERKKQRDNSSGRNEEDSNHRKQNENKNDGDNQITENDDDINVTPRSTDRRITFWSINGEENIEMLKESCDYNVPKTKGFANKLAGKASLSDGTFNIEQLCEIFDYCYSKWRYVNDPKGSEYLAKASETIASSLTGDCDDFAILIASCMLAIGGDVCIVTAQGPTGGHAYAEVDISHMKLEHVKSYIKQKFNSHRISNIVYRKDGSYIWLNLDWSGDYPGGPTFKASTRDIYKCVNGRWSFIKQ